MMKTKFLLSFLALVGLVFAPPTTHAQTYQPSNRTPVADNTLGTQVSGTGTNFTITGGVSKGQTLFQSFRDFSVPTNGQANFLNPVDNRDIITRVTGNLFSDINGTVNTNGANFFLINPNGIVFGNNARLDVGKAFVGSTANSIDLVNGSGGRITFGTNLNGDALLKVAPNVLFDVSRLNLGGGNGAISNFGTLQTPNNNQYISLIGGNVTLDGSMGGGKIIAPGGRVDIGGLKGAGTVTIDNNGFAFGGTGLQRSDVSLIDGASISVRATGTLDTVNTFFNNATANGSSLNISANNLDLLNAGANSNTLPAAINAGLETNSGVQTKSGGNINIDATGRVNLDNSDIKNTLRSGAEGTIGNIKIQSGTVEIQNNSAIASTTAGNGNAGNIDLKVNGDLNLTNGGLIVSDTQETARGNAGDINIQANGNIKIDGNKKFSTISSDTFGYGDTGKIVIDTQGKLLLANKGIITSSIGQTGVGNGRGISIAARELELVNTALIETSTEPINRIDGKGNGGDINIKTTGDIRIAGSNSLPDNSTSSQISTIYSNSNGYGDTGKIVINTQGKLLVTSGGIITNEVAQNGVGNSKGIAIAARELELANGSHISTSKFQTDRADGKGNAGDIDIKTTGDIKVSGYDSSVTNPISDISFVSSANNGRGNAGKITIDTKGKLSVVDRGLIFSSIGEKAAGNSQGINISAGGLELNNLSFISTTTFQTASVNGTGNGGDINLDIKGAIVANNSELITGSSGIGKSGDLNLNVTGSISANNSTIVTGSNGTGSTGNISVNSDRLLLNKSDILSVGKFGTGGDVNIFISDKILLRNNSTIDSQSGSLDRNGNGGNITISSPLIIALPGNNDINANANGGTGGNVNITSQGGLFGIKYRAIGSDSTNDITASSNFGQNGAVKIDTPGTDPGKNSNELPQVPTDASNQISQVCGASNRQNKLTVAGRGGLPPNADDLLTPNIVWRDARATNSQSSIGSANTPAQLAPPAVGWLLDGKGRVTLVAAATNGQQTGTSVVCPQAVK